MKKMIQWVLAATLICGASVMTSCNDDDDNSPAQEQTKKNRTEFVSHTRASLKEVAENLNFSTWNSVNYLNLYLNQYVLLNPNFEKTFSRTFLEEVMKSKRPNPDESGLYYRGDIDMTQFNYTFTATMTGFDVATNDDEGLVFVFPTYAPEAEQAMTVKLVLNGKGNTYTQRSDFLSSDSTDIYVTYGDRYECALYTATGSEELTKRITIDIDLAIRQAGTGFADFRNDAWNITYNVKSAIPGDATELVANIGQDPSIHQAGMTFDYTHNGKKTLGIRAVLNNLGGMNDLSQLTTTSSLLSVLTAIMVGNSIDDLQLTLLDDLTTSVKVSDCSKMLGLVNQMATARRNYADQQTIEGYTSQLNQLITCSMTDKHLGQTIPMKLATAKVGIDYWTVPALDFSDGDGYVALTDMLDKESIEYGLNIIDHASDPLQQSIIVVRQLQQAFLMMIDTLTE